ncbi:MAG TPA: hypothetical protein VK400_16635, partial [Pyrinomonadaceae bacterium]|nr:hypothetical protein [Pyrinomonadaceae bacterium]
MKETAFFLIVVFLSNFSALNVGAQSKTAAGVPSFDEIELLVQNGNNVDEKRVRVRFEEDSLTITSKNGAIGKTFRYADIRSAEYSYSKNPRWKTGLGLGAAGIIFPPLLLVALPMGFSKHRRHWLTVRTGEDYAVLKLSKSSRKLFIPAFETKSG